jgi:hypothetical protein
MPTPLLDHRSPVYLQGRTKPSPTAIPSEAFPRGEIALSSIGGTITTIQLFETPKAAKKSGVVLRINSNPPLTAITFPDGIELHLNGKTSAEAVLHALKLALNCRPPEPYGIEETRTTFANRTAGYDTLIQDRRAAELADSLPQEGEEDPP